jgi:hypothetical protein
VHRFQPETPKAGLWGANGRRVSPGRFRVVGCRAFRLDFAEGLGGETEERTIHKPALAYRFWRLLLSCACTNPRALEYVVMMIVIFLHVGPFAAHIIADLETQIAAIDRGEQPETMRKGARAGHSVSPTMAANARRLELDQCRVSIERAGDPVVAR